MANIITSTFAPFSLPNSSITEFMVNYNPDNVTADTPVHTDVISGKTITYGGLREEAAKGAYGLRHRLGLKEGDVLSVMLPNCTDFVLLAHSTWWAGAIFSPANTASSVSDVAHILNLVRPTHVCVDSNTQSKVQEAIKKSDIKDTPPKLFTAIDRVEGLLKFPEDITTSDRLPVYSLTEAGLDAKTTPATICFSSGTTGAMKAVQLSHYNITMNCLQTRVSLPYIVSSHTREVFFPPYCHIYGLSVVVTTGMWMGNFTCALPAFDLETFCKQMEKHKATMAHIVPPVAVLLANSEVAARYDLSNLEIVVVAAAPLGINLQSKIKERFPKAKVLQGYGLSECSPTVMHQTPNDEQYVGTVGKVICGTEVRLVDPSTGKDAIPGQEGELWVRGPQVMMGYRGNPKATAETMEGDWLRTGDIMRMDENLNFWVTDRLKEMIKYKGFQVAPSELEDHLLKHPYVIDAAVSSTYNEEQATEVPLAYVSLTDEHKDLGATEKQKVLEEIRGWVDGIVAGYKKLRGGVFHLQALPKTPSGKILRRDLPHRLKENRLGKL